MKKIKIGNKSIGDEEPCFVIAEAGANFRISNDAKVNYKHALKLIDIAVEAKADAVKFQLYRAKKLYVEGAGTADYIRKRESINKLIQEMELPYEWLPRLKNYCVKNGVIFLCTPFDEESADELEKVGTEAYKIASYTINDLSLLSHIAKKGKPIILSTGAADLNDIGKAMDTIKRGGNKEIALMQCTAKYPAPLDTINLRVIPELKKRFSVPIGFSDHSREPFIAPMGAVALGANIIEKHYTTDNNLPGPDHGFAILPNELKETIKTIRLLEKALGKNKKEVEVIEKELYKFCRGSIYAIKDIKKGDSLTKENIAVLRGGNKKRGLEPENFEKILRKKVLINIKKNDPIERDAIK